MQIRIDPMNKYPNGLSDELDETHISIASIEIIKAVVAHRDKLAHQLRDAVAVFDSLIRHGHVFTGVDKPIVKIVTRMESELKKEWEGTQ